MKDVFSIKPKYYHHDGDAANDDDDKKGDGKGGDGQKKNLDCDKNLDDKENDDEEEKGSEKEMDGEQNPVGEDVHLDSDELPFESAEEVVGRVVKEVEEEFQRIEEGVEEAVEEDEEAVEEELEDADGCLSQWFDKNVNEVIELCAMQSFLLVPHVSLSLPPLPNTRSLNRPPNIRSLTPPTFHLLSQDVESSQPLISDINTKPVEVVVEAALDKEKFVNANSPKIVQPIFGKRQVKPSRVCRSPYINNKTIIRPDILKSEFFLSMEIFSMFEDQV